MGVIAVGGDLVRFAEWRKVRRFSRDVRGAPAGLAVLGEAGAGKSTLWRAGVETAVAAGYHVLRSEPSASEIDLPFAGLSDLLADLLPVVSAQIPGPQLEALEVALLLRPAGEDPPTAHAIGLGVLAGLRGGLSEGPVLIAIDDVQWLDEASREALTFALRRIASGPLSVMVAARTGAVADPLTAGAPPPPDGWRELLAALPAAEVIDLAPLDMWQIQNLLPRTVTAAQAREVARQSRGNPFWAVQIVAGLEGAESQVPPLARTLTESLSRSLNGDAAAALAAVGAAGRISVPDALAVLERLQDPAAALDAAITAGVAVETERPAVGRASADRRRRGGVVAAGSPHAAVSPAGRGHGQPGAARALRGPGRGFRTGRCGRRGPGRGRRSRARPGRQRSGCAVRRAGGTVHAGIGFRRAGAPPDPRG